MDNNDFHIEKLIIPKKHEIKKQKKTIEKKLRTLKEVLYLLNILSKEEAISLKDIDKAFEKLSTIDLDNLDVHLNERKTIGEISNDLRISSSTVQRDLSSELKVINSRLYNIVQNIMKQNLAERAKKGGSSFARNNIPLKDEQGKFIGSKKK